MSDNGNGKAIPLPLMDGDEEYFSEEMVEALFDWGQALADLFQIEPPMPGMPTLSLTIEQGMALAGMLYARQVDLDGLIELADSWVEDESSRIPIGWLTVPLTATQFYVSLAHRILHGEEEEEFKIFPPPPSGEAKADRDGRICSLLGVVELILDLAGYLNDADREWLDGWAKAIYIETIRHSAEEEGDA
ncbi:MAG: hypothetical protein D6759_19665 [Chloroflexi bacterium]|nr:MAG: hypothetical protein D6759_19665 [Chloroflexota bacterium]